MPPGSATAPRTESQTINHILSGLDHISGVHPHSGFIITGDFNKMKDRLLKAYPLKQIVRDPTHKGSILDCVYTNLHQYYRVPQVEAGLGLSLHGVVKVTPKYVTPNRDECITWSRKSTETAKRNFVTELSQVNWTPLYRMELCSDQFEFFQRSLTTLLDEHLPLQKQVKRSTDKPWVTNNYKNLIRKRQRAYKQGNLTLYKYYKNKVNKLGKRLRKNYYSLQIDGLLQSNPAQWWKATRNFLGLAPTNAPGREFNALINNEYGGDTSAFVQDVNKFLQSVSSHLVPISTAPAPAPVGDIPDRYIIGLEEVEEKLMNVKLKKAPGPDGLPNWVLRDLSKILAGPICAIFNSSIRQSYIPLLWKSANVTPLAKVTPPQSVDSDIRPISLLPVVGKLLESSMGLRILAEISEKIDPRQFGGLSGSSTTLALIDMLHKWHLAAHASKATRILFLDYSKAFDLVDHRCLLHKFKSLGLSPVPLAWLHNYLTNRRQRVKLGMEVSDWASMNGAMPQGSWLGPLCFVIYIQDMPVFQNLFTHKYIDDTTISQSVPKGKADELQSALSTINNWSISNHMKINIKKTKEMLIDFKLKPYKPEVLHLDNSLIERVDTFKLLGVWISRDLTWHTQVDKMVAKCNQRLYLLKQLKRSGLQDKELLMYYQSVIRSVTEYACEVWHAGLTKELSEDIEKIQKRALRIISPSLEYQDALAEFHLAELKTRREQLCKKLFNRMQAPSHKLHNILPPRKSHRYETSTSHHRVLPVAKIKNNRLKSDFLIDALLNHQD